MRAWPPICEPAHLEDTHWNQPQGPVQCGGLKTPGHQAQPSYSLWVTEHNILYCGLFFTIAALPRDKNDQNRLILLEIFCDVTTVCFSPPS